MIKTKPQQKPITSTEAMARPPQRGVGATIGDRRAHPVPSTVVSRNSVDSFNRPATKRPANLSAFAPDTAYKAGRASYAKGVPYKNAVHDKIEKGELVPISLKEVKRPTDNAILRFLDKVIALA